jgi:AcrR family transcriptional regulator
MKKGSKVKFMQMILSESLFSLLKTKPIEKITVTEICKLSNINRGTFYAYFLDPHDLLSKIEMDLYEKLETNSKKPSDLDTKTIKVYFRCLFDLLYDNKELMKVLFGEFGDRKFLVKCGMLGYEGAINDWHKKVPDVDRSYLEYIFAYVYNGCLGIVELWIKNDYQESPAEMATLVSKFFTENLAVYFDYSQE